MGRLPASCGAPEGGALEGPMWNLADIMQAAQGGQAMMNLAQQFGLSQAQTQRAVEALLPAFSLGLQRQAQTATSFASMLGLMSTGKFVPFFEQQTKAAEADTQGGVVIDQLFGSPEISRQVAAHAAVLSGVPTEVLMRMQPILAAMIMGGLFKTAMESGLGSLFAQMNEIMQKAGMPGMPGLGAPAEAKPESETHAGPSGDVFAPLLGSMFTGFFGKPEAADGAKPSKATDHTIADPAQQGLAQLSRLFEAGSQVQRDYVETMQKIFDRMSGDKT
jgi:hypothetical protein